MSSAVRRLPSTPISGMLELLGMQSVKSKNQPQPVAARARLDGVRIDRDITARKQLEVDLERKSSTRRWARLELNTDFGKGMAFVLLSVAVYAALLLVQRPHWASPG